MSLSLNEERASEQRWAAVVSASAPNRLREKYPPGPKARVFGALKLSRMRARSRELLREEVARTVAQAEDGEEALRHLYGLLIAGG